MNPKKRQRLERENARRKWHRRALVAIERALPEIIVGMTSRIIAQAYRLTPAETERFARRELRRYRREKAPRGGKSAPDAEKRQDVV